jgi:putative ABC transport system substrate-binding protein
VLVNPTALNNDTVKGVQTAAENLGLRLRVLHASTEAEIDTAFAALAQIGARALAITSDTFFNARTNPLAALALRHRIPVVYQYREFAAAGGLLSYGAASLTEMYHLVGIYTGRILKGEKPADLPVQQVTKVELVINMKTAMTLGITVPLTLLGRADKVIE